MGKVNKEEINAFAAAIGSRISAGIKQDIETVLDDMPEGPEKDEWRMKLYPVFRFCDHGMGVCDCGFLKRCADCNKES